MIKSESRFRLVCLLALTLAVNALMFAQSADRHNKRTFDIAVEGVFDRITEKELAGAKYKLIDVTGDSILRRGKALRHAGTADKSFFRETEIPVGGVYKLLIAYPGYEEYAADIDGGKVDRKEYVLFLGKIFLDKKAKELKEVTVQATKVKFYHRGDTLVYNADAFVMAEGSMLDDIIRQLPGVELKENGQILVNGRFVESLLLNGKDFFKGNRELMLKNLAAYTVKDIEVYERQKDIDRMLGLEFGEKLLTMDVRLKKEYHHAFMGNVEAGYGTENRYLGRLFSMWSSDHARVSLIGNVNNLNETRKPGMEQTFTPDQVTSGRLETYIGGVDYSVDNKKTGWQLNGDVVVKRNILDDATRTYTTNYLSSGDTYGRSFSSTYNKDFILSTSHEFQSMGRWHFIGLHPSFEYNNNSYESAFQSAVFDTDIQNVTSEMIRAIFDGSNNVAVGSLINRELREQLDKGRGMNAKLWSNGRFRLNTGLMQSISYLLSGSYSSRNVTGSNRFGINFGHDPEFDKASDRNIKNSPDYKYNLKAAVGYQSMPSRNVALDIYYEYSHDESREESNLYMLDQMYGGIGQNEIGCLPSYREYLYSLNPALSYDSRHVTDLHTLSPTVQWRSRQVRMEVKGDVCVERQHIDYLRNGQRHLLNRTKFRPGNMNLTFKFPMNRDESFRSQFRYELVPKSPDLVNMIDVTDERDPMNVFIGNADLKNSYTHKFRFVVDGRNSGGTVSQNYVLSSNIYDNLLSVGYDYNTDSGVKRSWMQNINGNWDINALQGVHIEIGKMRRFFIENTARLYYVRSVDRISENLGGTFENKINLYGASEELKFGYNNAGNKAEVFFKGDIQHFGGDTQGFKSFNAGDFSYGLRGVVKLPSNFQIATDFTVYSRRGYSDTKLNTDNFVLNARFSYSIPKVGLTLMADGYDILHNLSSVTYRMNAQSRTETYHTVLPRYFLFHIQWTFNKNPKNQ